MNEWITTNYYVLKDGFRSFKEIHGDKKRFVLDVLVCINNEVMK